MNDRKIQLFTPSYHIEECLNEIKECLQIGWTGMGFKTTQFEQAWKNYTGLPHAHFLNSNTAGLHLAFSLFKHEHKWQDGDEVVTTPLTFVSTNHAILYSNLKPVFADIDNSLCLDPNSVERQISSKTRAIIFVGIGGNAGRLQDIVDICTRRKLVLILDAAHMAGTKLMGVHVGAGIDCTVFSFHSVKNLPTADSGMICFNDTVMDQRARKWSWLGIDQDTYLRAGGSGGNYKWLYNVEHVGYKEHGNSIMAAIGLVQLKYLEEHNAFRRKLCSLYEKCLSTDSRIGFIPHYANCVSSRHLFQIRVPKSLRNPMVTYLNANNIFPGVHYRSNTEYPMYAYGYGTCPNAETASAEIISLPLHLKLTEDDVAYVSEVVMQFLKSNINL